MGTSVGLGEGTLVGVMVGSPVGFIDGCDVGSLVGVLVGLLVGLVDGDFVLSIVGLINAVGDPVGDSKNVVGAAGALVGNKSSPGSVVAPPMTSGDDTAT